jgi:hypothetical protein
MLFVINPFFHDDEQHGEGWKDWGEKVVKGIANTNKVIAPVLNAAAVATGGPTNPAGAAFTAVAAAPGLASTLGKEWDKSQAGSGKKKWPNHKGNATNERRYKIMKST